MARRIWLTEEDHRRVTAAVAEAELTTSGEIVTVLADRSDGYTDVAMAWAAFAALAALGVLAIFPDFYLHLFSGLFGLWVLDWTPREIFTLAAVFAALKFFGVLAVQLWEPLKFFLIPGPIRSARVRERALRAFLIGANSRTTGRTGVLIYLSMREHRAEIIADEAIAAKVPPEVWGAAMAAMLGPVKDGRVTDGMVAAVEEVGKILSPHFPRADDDMNELPDRLIEV
jgi:putative membrane protein